MPGCTCSTLNVISGDMARDFVAAHLEMDRIDGMARRVHRCPDTGIEWVEERQPVGYGDDVTVLRRLR